MDVDVIEITCCRLCNGELEVIYDFGDMSLTGVFFEDGSNVPNYPITFASCKKCGLCQLGHNYRRELLYGDTYGYESGLNSEMREHLKSKAENLQKKFQLEKGDKILDIASNDGTFLSYFSQDLSLFGIDPLIDVLGNSYPENVEQLKGFFGVGTSEEFNNLHGFKLVTSNSVLYDLENPVLFAQQVYRVLSPGGVWHFEQSYLPSMVNNKSFDTICHEHLLYFGLKQIKMLLDITGFYILDIEMNEINGGSVAISARKGAPPKEEIQSIYAFFLEKEKRQGFHDGSRVKSFFKEVETFRSKFTNLLKQFQDSGHTVYGLGASTKGNVLLQYCEINQSQISAIGEINPRKFGKQTPGSSIPIISEVEVLEMDPTHTLIVCIPWHFRRSLLSKCASFIARGGKVLFPLPNLEVFSRRDSQS